jgi:hypothetical protein
MANPESRPESWRWPSDRSAANLISTPAAKAAFGPDYFHFCKTVIFVKNPLLPNLYKAFFAV